MKSEGRIKLGCRKNLKCGKVDKFTLIVSEKNKDSIIRMYQQMGYDVH